jgi:hypothetical protein
MAWPKLRSHKSPGQEEAVGNHSGAAPDGAQLYPAPPAASEPRVSEPDVSEPGLNGPAAAWPGGDITTDERSADADADFGESSDVPFWNWGKPEDVADSHVPVEAGGSDVSGASGARAAAGSGSAGSEAAAGRAAANGTAANGTASGAGGGVPRQASRPVITPVEPAQGEQPDRAAPG